MNDEYRRQDRGGDARGAVLSEGPWGAQEADAVPEGASEENEAPEERNPWRQAPRRRPRLPHFEGRQTPSIEELVRRGRQRFGGGMPGGGRPIWGYALVAFVLLWLATTSIHRVDSQERGVVTRFGRYVRTLQPGIGFSLPAPVDVVTRVDVDRVRDLDVPQAGGDNLLVTADHDLVDLAYTVKWTVADPKAYLFTQTDPEELVRDVAESAMRAAVARQSFDQVSGPARDDIEAHVARRAQAVLDRMGAGIAVEGVTIRQADPPAAIADAIKGVSDAQSQAGSDLDSAQSYAQEVNAAAKASSAAFDKVYATYKAAPAVTRSRIYYETMEAVLSRTNKVIVDTPGVSPTIVLPGPAGKAAPAAQPGAADGNSAASATAATDATGNTQ